ncbi:DUF5344 family protein [Metabacillus sp. 84]|uniref:DUF5344 family protein n=1 Tax=Metabacillus sp. 84 TaxID=3404705 RepID=UPI003CFABCC7
MSKTIKLDHAQVMSQLEEIEKALDSVAIAAPSDSAVGDNKLSYTDAWFENEKAIHEQLELYVKAVRQNIADTKSNVTSLKEQDEAITSK